MSILIHEIVKGYLANSFFYINKKSVIQVLFNIIIILLKKIDHFLHQSDDQKPLLLMTANKTKVVRSKF